MEVADKSVQQEPVLRGTGSVKLENATMTIDPLADANRARRREIPLYSLHLDLIRGLAALAVMIGHLKFFLGSLGRPASGGGGFVPPLAPDPNQMNPAHEAVIVFFVLSGVLVGGSVLREHGARTFSWGQYLLKRLSRLLTVLVPALLIGFVIDSTTKYVLLQYPPRLTMRLGELSHVHLDWKTFLGNLFFLQTLDRTRIPSFGTNAALWSLAFEFWYYLLFPLMIGALLLRSRRRQFIYGTLSVAVACFLWRDPLTRFPVWLLGAFATRLPRFLPERWQRPAVTLLAVQFVVCAGVLWIRPLANFVLDDMILGVSFSALVVAILHRRASHPRTFYANLAENLAKPSYSVYLFHLPIVTLIGTCSVVYLPSLVGHRFAAIGIIASVTYGLCYLLYFAFEARTESVRKLGGRLFGLRRVQGVPALGGPLQVERSMPT
jgi:peptidoglycan/LPS O-acetylase OafA/YrhL